MKEVSKCPNCGAPAPLDSNSCAYCGCVFSDTPKDIGQPVLNAKKGITIENNIKNTDAAFYDEYYYTFGYIIIKKEEAPNGIVHYLVKKDLNNVNRSYLDLQESKIIELINDVKNKRSKQILSIVPLIFLFILGFGLTMGGVMATIMSRNDDRFSPLIIIGPMFLFASVSSIISLALTTKKHSLLRNKKIIRFLEETKQELFKNL